MKAIKRASGDKLKAVLRKFNDPGAVDKLAKANAEIEDMKEIMISNIRKVSENVDKLEIVEEKSSEMVIESKKFKEESHSLERIMYWRNVKLNIIIGIIIVAVLAYFIMPMMK